MSGLEAFILTSLFIIFLWLISPVGYNILNTKIGQGNNKAKFAYTSLPKFEFKMEDDQAFIVHNDFPKFLAKLGDGDVLIDEIKWGDISPKSLKEKALRDMEDWYQNEFQDWSRKG